MLTSNYVFPLHPSTPNPQPQVLAQAASVAGRGNGEFGEHHELDALGQTFDLAIHTYAGDPNRFLQRLEVHNPSGSRDVHVLRVPSWKPLNAVRTSPGGRGFRADLIANDIPAPYDDAALHAVGIAAGLPGFSPTHDDAVLAAAMGCTCAQQFRLNVTAQMRLEVARQMVR